MRFVPHRTDPVGFRTHWFMNCSSALPWTGGGPQDDPRDFNASRARGPKSSSSIGSPAALLGQLARVSKYDLRLPVAVADLPCHADTPAAERGFGSAELGPMISIYDRGKNRLRV